MSRLKKGITIWRKKGKHLFLDLCFLHFGIFHLYFMDQACVLAHLLLAAVSRLRPLGGATERSAVVTEVTGRVHLMLNEVRQRRRSANTSMWTQALIWNVYKTSLQKLLCITDVNMQVVLLTSRISNLSMLTLPQVFFSLAMGLMFIPAERWEEMSEWSIYRDKPEKLDRSQPSVSLPD